MSASFWVFLNLFLGLDPMNKRDRGIIQYAHLLLSFMVQKKVMLMLQNTSPGSATGV